MMADGISKKRKLVSAQSRRAQIETFSLCFVKKSSNVVYERKWKQFRVFCTDKDLQDEGICIDSKGPEEPSSKIVGNLLECFY